MFPSPFTTWDIEQSRALIYEHPNRQRVRWWRAISSPSYDRLHGVPNRAASPPTDGEYVHEEQDVADYLALVQKGESVRRYVPQGQYVEGMAVVVTMPGEIPLGDHDWVVPIGNFDYGTDGVADTATYRNSETLTRAGYSAPGAGTLVSSDTAITGTSTAFLSFLSPGDVVTCAKQSVVVQSVEDDTHWTALTAPVPAWGGHSYSKGADTLLYYPVSDLVEVIDAAGTLYTQYVDYQLASDERTVQWINPSNCPAPGVRYSVLYRYLPKFEALPEMGTHRFVYKGQGLPQRTVVRLYKPDTHRE